MAQINSLRPISQRLTSTPVEELPRYAGFLASSVLSLSDVFKNSSHQKSETSSQIHKLTVRITSLLQDKSQEGRFTGIVLVQALVETAGLQVLESFGSTWVRSLLSCLNKQDPPEVKKLAIFIIARIFILTKPYQSMVREITTPNLPAFITASLACIKPTVSVKGDSEKLLRSPLLEAVLQCWKQLIEMFPSTFRPFIPPIRKILLDLLSDETISRIVFEASSTVFALLHFCAPKDAVVSEWASSCRNIIESGHQVADNLFRSIIEEWSTVTSRQAPTKTGKKISSQPRSQATDTTDMGKWSGVRAGAERAKSLIKLLSSLLTTQHAQAVQVPLSQVLDLTARFVAVVRPTEHYALRENKDISRDEREELFMNLANLHCAVAELHTMLTMTYGHSLLPVSNSLFSQVFDIFESGSADERVRTITYDAIAHMLQERSIALNVTNSEQISILVQRCCLDATVLDAKDTQMSQNTKGLNNGALTVEIQQSSSIKSLPNTSRVSPLTHSAQRLLLAILSHVPAFLLSSSIRADIDRTIILTNHKDAMLASIISPPQSQNSDGQATSILPFLSRLSGYDMAREALMRPRRPILRDEIRVRFEDVNGSQLPISRETSTSRSRTPSIASTNTQGPLETPSGQLEEELSDQLYTESQMTKKREHEKMQSETALNEIESSKKIKTDALHSTSTTNEQVVLEYPAEDDGRGRSDLSSKPESERNLSKVETVSSIGATEGLTLPLTGTINSGMLEAAGQSQDYDSDDSEIPQIDATLSSDDEDEDMDD